jgi:hypothetical protein
VIPGTVSKLSEQRLTAAATIFPKTDVVYVTGTTAIATIVPTFQGFSGILFLVATSSGLTAVTTGNIQLAITFVQNKVATLVYSKLNAKWFPSV